MIALMLADVGLDVVHASGATQAVIRGEELRPAVIVLDVRLPDGDGSDVVAEFRRRGTLARTPLVVYSAADVDESRRDELQLGRTVFLTKGRTSPEELQGPGARPHPGRHRRARDVNDGRRTGWHKHSSKSRRAPGLTPADSTSRSEPARVRAARSCRRSTTPCSRLVSRTSTW